MISYLHDISDASFSLVAVSMQGEQLFELESSSVSPSGWYSKTLNGGPNSPFDLPFYFVLYVQFFLKRASLLEFIDAINKWMPDCRNLAVGGKYPGDPSADILMPNTFEIDYIRVFGKN